MAPCVESCTQEGGIRGRQGLVAHLTAYYTSHLACPFERKIGGGGGMGRECRVGRGWGWEGGCKSCVRAPTSSPPPFLLLCDGIGADLRRCREGKERSRGAHLHLITPWLLARYKTLCGATDPSDSRTVTLNETQRRGHAGSAYHYHLSWGNKQGPPKSCHCLLRRLIWNYYYISAGNFVNFS